VTEYKIPGPAAGNPITPLFDQQGTLWFTLLSNQVGKLDPATGAITLKTLDTPKANPTYIGINSKGVPFFTTQTNKIGSINPQTMEITEHVLPEGALPRRVVATADDVIWYTDMAKGLLGRLDPKTGQVKEFASPGGPKSLPQSLAVTRNDIIWFTEGAPQPNTLVRFDPKTAAMQSWPVLTKGGLVTHMVAAPDGTLWFSHAGVGKVARVQVSAMPSQQ
jgi:virginiamycin B lyase